MYRYTLLQTSESAAPSVLQLATPHLPLTTLKRLVPENGFLMTHYYGKYSCTCIQMGAV